MNIGAIDIGSNSIKLLIIEIKKNKLYQLLHKYKITAFSRNMSKENNLDEKSIDNAVKTIKNYIELCTKYNVIKICIIATEFARKALNINILLDKTKKATNHIIDILSGEEEAKLTFFSASCDFEPNNHILSFNIGGGSTEITIGSDKKIEFVMSLPLGTGILTRNFLSSIDSISKKEYQYLTNFIKQELSKTTIKNFLKNDTILIASGSTAINLVQIKIGKKINWINFKNLPTIKLKEIRAIEKILINYNLQERKKIGGIDSDRADILPAGIAIVTTLTEFCKQEKIFTTQKSLAYGTIIDLYNKYNKI